MRPQARTIEQVVARIASAQHGVVTRRQLLGAGISAAAIQRRVGKGALLPVHRGVYRVGHRAPSIQARYMAAVLACGKDAVLSGRAAGYLHGLIQGLPPEPEVTAPTERQVKGIRCHRSRASDGFDATTCRGIPVTKVPRTLVDLAATLAPSDLARACHEAHVRHRTTPADVELVLRRRPLSPGAATVRTVLNGEVGVTLSGLERRFLYLLRKARLPLPQTNIRAGRRIVDCRWPDLRLTVELDSYRYHASRHAWEMDRQREREAYARGDELRRYTRDDVFSRSEVVIRELRSLLAGTDPA